MSKKKNGRKLTHKKPIKNNSSQIIESQVPLNSISNWFGFFKERKNFFDFKLPINLPNIRLFANGFNICGFPIYYDQNSVKTCFLMQLALSTYFVVKAEIDKVNTKLFTDKNIQSLYRLDVLTGYWYGNTDDHEAVANSIIEKCQGIMTERNSTLDDFVSIKELYARMIQENHEINGVVQRLYRAVGDNVLEEFENCLISEMENSVATEATTSPLDLVLKIGAPIVATLLLVAVGYCAYRKLKAKPIPETLPLIELKK